MSTGDRCGNRLPKVGGAGRAPHVCGETFAIGQYGFDGSHDCIVGTGAAQVLHHHGSGPDCADGVGDALAGDVGGGAVHRFEHGREPPFGVDVGRRRDGDGAGAGRTQVREDVSKQVGANHDIEMLRHTHEIGGENIDVVLIDRDVRIVCGHCLNPAVPVRHGVKDTVGFGGRGQMTGRAVASQFEGVFDDPVGSVAGEQAGLGNDLVGRAFVLDAADHRVFAFDVLTHHKEIDISRPLARQRAGHPVEQPHRSQIDVLVEGPPDQYQKPPE